MESSSVGPYNASPDSTMTDAKSTSTAPAEVEPPSQHGGDNVPAAADAAPPTGRPSEGARSTSGTGGGEQVTHQMTHSYSLSAIPTEQGHRDKKRPSARSSLPAGYSEASYRSEEYAHRQSPKQQQQLAPHQMDSLPRPYPPQSKSFGYTPKDLSRSMGSTALQREDSSGGYAVESSMAKGDPGRAVRIDYKAPVPHGLSRSLPKQSYFPDQEGERMYYPSRSAMCLQDLPQKQQYAEPYYPPHMLRKADPGGRVSSSSSFKPKRVDDRYGEQQRYYAPYSTGYMHHVAAYDDAEYRKKMVAYTGDQRWMYNRYAVHPQQYAVHMMQEAGANEACREAGDTVVVKSSGDSGSEVSKYAAMAQKQAAEDVSSMYVIVRDAQTGTDTPLPATVDVGEESPPPSKAVEMPLLGEDAAPRKQDDSGSSSSSSSDEDDEESSSSSSSESSSSSASPEKQGHVKDYLTPEVVKQQMIAQHLQQLQMQHQQQLMNMTPKEYANYQEALRIYENYCQQAQNQQTQQQLMMQHRQQLQQQQQNLIQQQSHQQLQQPPQQPPQQLPQQLPQQTPQQPPQQQLQPQQMQQQASQQQFYQQQQFDPRAGPMPEKKKSVYFAGSEGAGEIAARVPGEGSSIRSFQSRTSNDIGTGEASVDDNRSLLSSNTNMGTPLLRPLLPERATRTATKDKMEHLCLAVNVILFSVLAGVVAAFIVQQVTHAM